MVAELSQPFLLSLIVGSLYTFMALGLTMTYAITKIPNFAHAEYVTVGAYAATVLVNSGRMGLVEGLFVAFAAGALTALASDELSFKPLFRRRATPLHLLVASIGVGLAIRYILSIFADVYDLLVAKMNVFAQPLLLIGEGYFTTLHAWILPTLFIAVALLHTMLHGTKLGKAMRAMASNFDLARASGINTKLVRRVTWIIAGGLAGVSGAFWSIFSPITPEVGWLALLRVFAASILGGMVSLYGTIVGGFIVGFSENMGMSVINTYFGLDTAYKPLIAFSIIVAVYLLRPRGFAGMSLPRPTTALQGLSALLRRVQWLK